MDHYFTNNKSYDDLKEFVDTIAGYSFKYQTTSGVFSKNHVDHLTKILIEVIADDVKSPSILDFGCGYGVVGMYFSRKFNTSIDMIDINSHACELAKQNAKLNNLDCNIFTSNLYSNVEKKYDVIITNPPIRAGKEICYSIYKEGITYLNNGGVIYLVISKKHGALSTIDYLKCIYSAVEVIYSKKGVFVVKACK